MIMVYNRERFVLSNSPWLYQRSRIKELTMERFTIMTFHNSCGKIMHINYRTPLSCERHEELETMLESIEGVSYSRGSDVYTVSVHITPKYDMVEVAPQVIFALASF